MYGPMNVTFTILFLYQKHHPEDGRNTAQNRVGENIATKIHDENEGAFLWLFIHFCI